MLGLNTEVVDSIVQTCGGLLSMVCIESWALWWVIGSGMYRVMGLVVTVAYSMLFSNHIYTK